MNFPSNFQRNILNTYPNTGEAWLNKLPHILDECERTWGLTNLQPLPNLSYSYVLSGLAQNTPIILKLSPDTEQLHREAIALQTFQYFGAIPLLNQKPGALLLTRAHPGTTLKANQPQHSRIEIACHTIRRLHQAPLLKNHSFPTIDQWLSDLDRPWNIPQPLLQKARTLKNLPFSAPPVLLHGDLHQDNILSNGPDWVVIDPKGVIGSPIYETWACVENPAQDLAFISQYFNYPLKQLTEIYYVRLILAACWQIEDNLTPEPFLSLAQTVFPLLEST